MSESTVSCVGESACPHVLLSAYQCAPGGGSVSQIGWEWYQRLAARTKVTLVTHIRNRRVLEAKGAPVGNSHIVYVDTEWFAGPLYRLARRLFPRSEHAVFMISSFDFYLYDLVAVATLRRHQQTGRTWDVVHLVTPVSPLASTRLHRLGGPLVLGPWNGGLASPSMFPEVMKQDSGWLYPVRRLGKFLETFLGGAARASMILTATTATRQSIPARLQPRCQTMLENGVDLDRFSPTPWPPPPDATHPLRLLFVGRLVPFKGVPMLLEAVARVRSPQQPILVRLLGEGPMAAEWRDVATSLALGEQVEFLGAGSLDQVAQQLEWAHVFCLPSVRESGGAVLLEAMAAARPVIAIRYGGPAELVDEEVGRPISPNGKEAVVSQITDALKDIFRQPDAWRERGRNGRRRAEQHYSWDAKVARAMALYQDLQRMASDA